MPPTRNIAIFVDTGTGFGRNIVRGVSRYLSVHGSRILHSAPENILSPDRRISHWRGDGIIAQVANEPTAELLSHVTVPIVNVSQVAASYAYPSVLPDNVKVGQLAAQHLIDRGFQNFAFLGYTTHAYSEIRGRSFAAAAEKAGFNCTYFERPGPAPLVVQPDPGTMELAQWLGDLPKPVGVMACNDTRASHVIQACVEAGVRIPEELALIGVDNDELICDMTHPPLSSINVSAEQVGYQAAALLDDLMSGRPAPQQLPILIPPTGVVVRRSTNILAIADPLVARAVRYIHDHAVDAIHLDDVVRTVPLSRRSLERRFSNCMRRSIGHYITAMRIDRAKALLIGSDMPTSQIAEKSGFGYTQQFNALFKKYAGLTPLQFRRHHRMG